MPENPDAGALIQRCTLPFITHSACFFMSEFSHSVIQSFSFAAFPALKVVAGPAGDLCSQANSEIIISVTQLYWCTVLVLFSVP